eukprot:3499088-Rhodomonas_salina.1
MSQRLALPQHPRKPPRSLCTNPVFAQIEMSQRLALPQHPRKPHRSLRTTLVLAQVETNQCFPK